MNERGHVENALLLSIGLGFILEGAVSIAALETIVKIGPPIVLGALFPDIDTSFGTHRKTFHNVWVLALALAFPFVFNNLHYVWIGIATHYVLDLLGNVKGMGIFYLLPGYFDIPVGVNIDSKWADVMTFVVTAFELVILWGGSSSLGMKHNSLGRPSLPSNARLRELEYVDYTRKSELINPVYPEAVDIALNESS